MSSGEREGREVAQFPITDAIISYIVRVMYRLSSAPEYGQGLLCY